MCDVGVVVVNECRKFVNEGVSGTYLSLSAHQNGCDCEYKGEYEKVL